MIIDDLESAFAIHKASVTESSAISVECPNKKIGAAMSAGSLRTTAYFNPSGMTTSAHARRQKKTDQPTGNSPGITV